MGIESVPNVIYKDDDAEDQEDDVLGAVDLDLIVQKDKVDEYS